MNLQPSEKKTVIETSFEFVHTEESKAYIISDPFTNKIRNGSLLASEYTGLFGEETIAIIGKAYNSNTDYLSLLAFHNVNNTNEEEVKSFLTKIQQFGNRITERKMRRLDLYFFIAKERGESYDKQLVLLEQYMNHNVLKHVPKKKLHIAYFAIGYYDFFEIVYDAINRSFKLSGIKDNLEELLYNSSGLDVLQA